MDKRQMPKVNLEALRAAAPRFQPMGAGQLVLLSCQQRLQEGEMPTAKGFEHFLRELGFSRTQASCIVNKGFTALKELQETEQMAFADLQTLLKDLRDVSMPH